jgi:superfamily I DNA/RNA helicase
MSNRIPSRYQKDIFNFVRTGTGNCVINAVAGSGKTTTIIASLRFIPTDKSVIFLAFNKSIVEEIKLKVPENVKVQTFHSLGCSAIYKSYGDKSRLENNKIYDIINNIAPRWAMIDKKEIDADYKGRVKKIVDLARLSLTHDEETLKELCYKHQIDVLGLEIERALKIINDANSDISTFDFTDMIYWPAKYDHFNLEKYDYVFVDECQDLNKTQHKLIEKISHAHTRLIAVGDRNQAIYGFAGADTESFDLLTKMNNTIILPLSVNYRCGSNIISLAKNFVNQIEAHDNAPEGVLEHNASFRGVLEGDMVLCRNTAPLVKLCLEYLHNNKKAYVKGADIGEELVRLIVRSNTKTTDQLKHWLDVEMKKVILAIKKKYPFLEDSEIKEHNTFILFYEKHLLINTIISNENLTDCNSLMSKIRQVFLDNSTGICLSTIHKAKGLECNRVFILDREKTMPSKFAKLPWQKEQERNLEYVAYTRAKNYLGIITDWTFFREKT